jgi:hypothetical protein
MFEVMDDNYPDLIIIHHIEIASSIILYIYKYAHLLCQLNFLNVKKWMQY